MLACTGAPRRIALATAVWSSLLDVTSSWVSAFKGPGSLVDQVADHRPRDGSSPRRAPPSRGTRTVATSSASTSWSDRSSRPTARSRSANSPALATSGEFGSQDLEAASDLHELDDDLGRRVGDADTLEISDSTNPSVSNCRSASRTGTR